MSGYYLGDLTLKNFRSFKNETIRFKRNGMCLLRGFNRDTGGSSYSGKSSVLNGIATVFGYCPFPIKDQQTWGTKGGMSVTQDLITEQGTWTITRGTKTSMKPPAGETITGAAAVDEKLRLITGVSPDILSALTYRRQGQRGLFLTKTDAQKKEFLSLVLNLGAFEVAGDVASKEAAAAQNRVATAQGRLQQLEAQVRSIPTTEPVVVDVQPFEEEVARLRQAAAEKEGKILEVERVIFGLNEECRVAVETVEEKFRAALREASEALVNARVPPVLPPVVEDQKAKTDLEDARKRLQRRIEADEALRQEFDVKCRALDQEIFNLTSLIAGVGRLQTEQAELKKKVAAAESSTCPTCEQPWLKAQEQLTMWKARLLRVEFDISTAEEAKTTLPAKVAARKEMKFQPDPKIEQFRNIVTQLTSAVQTSRLASENARKQIQAQHSVQVAEKQAAVSKLQAEQAKEVAAARASIEEKIRELREQERVLRLKLASDSEGFRQMEWRLKSTVAENDQRKREHAQRVAQLAELMQQIEQAKQQVVEEEKALKAELDFEDLVGYKGFLGVIFDEILAEITEETNAILAAVANTSHVTVNFVSEAIAQKTGVARKEIRPVVTIGGWPASLESGASGGMLSSIDLAVDLAVANVISKRTNSWPGWMVLDECFEGMDPITKETCMEMLSKQADNRLILVVDHASETKELFTDFIDIEFRNGQSTIMENK